MGDYDPHTYVCLEKQPFYVISSQVDKDTAQWQLPFFYYSKNESNLIQAILGLGNGDPTNDPNLDMNFINRAYEAGEIMSNVYSFQAINGDGDQRYASMTIGGYSDRLYKSKMEWYSLNPTTPSNDGDETEKVSNWRLTFSNFTLDTFNMCEPPSSSDSDEPQVYKGSLLDADPTTEFKVYGHFNTGYPFIGVDENVFEIVHNDLKHFRPDVDCDFDNKKNPASVCYWKAKCDPNLFGEAKLDFAFGSDALFSLPMKELLVDYEYLYDDYCGFAMQKVDMPFDLEKERHFYFGDVFFMNYAGVFDFTEGKIGMALS